MADSRNDFKLVDFRLTLVIGILFMGLGALAKMLGMGLFGLLLFGIGIANKSRWGKEKKWSELTESERKGQRRGLIGVAAFGLLVIVIPIILAS